MNKELGEILKALNQRAVQRNGCLKHTFKSKDSELKCDFIKCENCPCFQNEHPSIYITQVIVTSGVLNE